MYRVVSRTAPGPRPPGLSPGSAGGLRQTTTRVCACFLIWETLPGRCLLAGSRGRVSEPKCKKCSEGPWHQQGLQRRELLR